VFVCRKCPISLISTLLSRGFSLGDIWLSVTLAIKPVANYVLVEF